MVGHSLSIVTSFVANDDPLGISGSMAMSPSMMIVFSFLNNFVSILNVDHVHSMGICAPPPSSGNLSKPSFRDIVQSSSNALMIQEAPAITIPFGERCCI